MPVVDLHIIEGYNCDEKRRLGESITDAIRFVIPAPTELVTVMIHDLPRENYYRGRTIRTPAPAKADPREVVQEYLGAMEARDLAKAQSYLGEGFKMYFPGAAAMTSCKISSIGQSHAITS